MKLISLTVRMIELTSTSTYWCYNPRMLSVLLVISEGIHHSGFPHKRPVIKSSWKKTIPENHVRFTNKSFVFYYPSLPCLLPCEHSFCKIVWMCMFNIEILVTVDLWGGGGGRGWGDTLLRLTAFIFITPQTVMDMWTHLYCLIFCHQNHYEAWYQSVKYVFQ